MPADEGLSHFRPHATLAASCASAHCIHLRERRDGYRSSIRFASSASPRRGHLRRYDLSRSKRFTFQETEKIGGRHGPHRLLPGPLALRLPRRVRKLLVPPHASGPNSESASPLRPPIASLCCSFRPRCCSLYISLCSSSVLWNPPFQYLNQLKPPMASCAWKIWLLNLFSPNV